jgi:hypothetical protein
MIVSRCSLVRAPGATVDGQKCDPEESGGASRLLREMRSQRSDGVEIVLLGRDFSPRICRRWSKGPPAGFQGRLRGLAPRNPQGCHLLALSTAVMVSHTRALSGADKMSVRGEKINECVDGECPCVGNAYGSLSRSASEASASETSTEVSTDPRRLGCGPEALRPPGGPPR